MLLLLLLVLVVVVVFALPLLLRSIPVGLGCTPSMRLGSSTPAAEQSST